MKRANRKEVNLNTLKTSCAPCLNEAKKNSKKNRK